ESLRIVERTAHHENAAPEGSGREAAPSGDGADGRSFRSEGHHAGSGDFTQHVNLVRARGGKIEIVIRLQGNILREVAVLEKSLEIHGNALAPAHQKAMRQVSQLDRS